MRLAQRYSREKWINEIANRKVRIGVGKMNIRNKGFFIAVLLTLVVTLVFTTGNAWAGHKHAKTAITGVSTRWCSTRSSSAKRMGLAALLCWRALQL